MSKKERTRERGQHYGDCWGKRWVYVEEGVRGINGNGKIQENKFEK